MQSGSYLIQDGGWLNLAGNSFQPDTLATQEFLSISSVAAYPRSQRVNDVLLQFEGTQGRNLAVFINNEYQQNPMLQSGTLRVTLPDNGQNVLLGVGEVFEGNNVRIIHQVMVDRSGGQVSLVGTAAR